MCFGVEEMSNVCVAVRVRPLTRSEEDQKAQIIVGVAANTIQVTNLKVQANQDYDNRLRIRQYAFDFCYWSLDSNHSEFASQESIYDDLGTKVLEAAFEGFNTCLLAYGQSGSGKTYTMMGSNGNPGLTPRICQGLFEKASIISDRCKFRTEVSFLEIYNERVRDLLCSTPVEKKTGHTLRVREHPKLGPCVQELSRHKAENYYDVQALIDKGVQKRSMAATKMHSNSSRSHAIFTIILSQSKIGELSSDVVSKIHLVDLAGSERSSVHTSKVRLKEGSNINKSLVALGSVICALGSPQRGQPPFVPYRDSVLTWLLKDSLGGNSKTIMVATISPSNTAYNETLSTLRYANQAKSIVNKPIINEDPNVTLVRELKAEITRLRELLSSFEKNQLFGESARRILTSDAEIDCNLINDENPFNRGPNNATILKRRSSMEEQMKLSDRYHRKRRSLEIVASFDKILEMHFNQPKNYSNHKPPPSTFLLNSSCRFQPDSLSEISETARTMQMWPIYLTSSISNTTACSNHFQPALVPGISEPTKWSEPAKSRDSASQTGDGLGVCRHANYRKVSVVARSRKVKPSENSRRIGARSKTPKTDRKMESPTKQSLDEKRQHSRRKDSKIARKHTSKLPTGSRIETIRHSLDRSMDERIFTQLLVCDICMRGRSSNPAPIQQEACHWPQMPPFLAVASATVSLDTTPAHITRSCSSQTVPTVNQTVPSKCSISLQTDSASAFDDRYEGDTGFASSDFQLQPTIDRIEDKLSQAQRQLVADTSRHFNFVPARNRSTQTPEAPPRIRRDSDSTAVFTVSNVESSPPIYTSGYAGIYNYGRWSRANHEGQVSGIDHRCRDISRNMADEDLQDKLQYDCRSYRFGDFNYRYRNAGDIYVPSATIHGFTADRTSGRAAGGGGGCVRHGQDSSAGWVNHTVEPWYESTRPSITNSKDACSKISQQACYQCRKPLTSTPGDRDEQDDTSANKPRYRPRFRQGGAEFPPALIFVTFDDENACHLNEYLKLPWTLSFRSTSKQTVLESKHFGHETAKKTGGSGPIAPRRSRRTLRQQRRPSIDRRNTDFHFEADPESKKKSSNSFPVDRWIEKTNTDISCDVTICDYDINVDYDIMALLAECRKVRQVAWQQIVGQHRTSCDVRNKRVTVSACGIDN